MDIEIKKGKLATVVTVIVLMMAYSLPVKAGGLNAVAVKGGSQFFEGEVNWMVKSSNKLVHKTSNKSFSVELPAGGYELGLKCPSGAIRTRMFTVGSGSARTDVVVSCD